MPKIKNIHNEVFNGSVADPDPEDPGHFEHTNPDPERAKIYQNNQKILFLCILYNMINFARNTNYKKNYLIVRG